MSNLITRIQEIIEAGFTQADLYQAAKVTKGTPNQWLNGKIKSIKLEYAQGIEALTGFRAEWIVTGKGPKTRVESEIRKEDLIEAADEVDEAIRLLGGSSASRRVLVADPHDPNQIEIRTVKLRLQAGITGFKTSPDDEGGESITLPKGWLQKKGYFAEDLIAIKVKGESMEESLYEGDLVVINTALKEMKHGDVYAFNYEGEAVIKRLHRDMRQWFLVSDNPDQRKYPRQRCEGAECIVIGKIVRMQSDHI